MNKEALFRSLVETYADALIETAGSSRQQIILFDAANKIFSHSQYNGTPLEYNWLFVDSSWLSEALRSHPGCPDVARLDNEIRELVSGKLSLRRWFRQILRDPAPALELAPAFKEALVTALSMFSDESRTKPACEDDDFIGIAYDLHTASFRCSEGSQSQSAAFRIDADWRMTLYQMGVENLPLFFLTPDRLKRILDDELRIDSKLLFLIEAIRNGAE